MKENNFVLNRHTFSIPKHHHNDFGKTLKTLATPVYFSYSKPDKNK